MGTLEETYQVQRCFTGKDRVCDTTYKIDMTTKDDYQCTNVETPNCFMEEKVINDVTCTNSVEFNCKRDKSTKNDGYGPKGVVCARNTATRRIARNNRGKFAISARRSLSGLSARCRRGSNVSTTQLKNAGMNRRNTATRLRRLYWRKSVI